ncbi:hypothetical protein D3C79_871480 [compost metagenome]
MAKAPTQKRRRTHLPEQPVQGFGTRGRTGGQEGCEFLGQVQQDRTRFEYPNRWLDAAIEQGGDLRVGVDLNEPTGELVAFADADQPGVVLGAAVAQGQQFFKKDGDFHAVGGCQRVQLQRVLANRQRLVVGRAGDRAVDTGELAARG